MSEEHASCLVSAPGACAFCGVERARIAWSSPLGVLPGTAAYWSGSEA